MIDIIIFYNNVIYYRSLIDCCHLNPSPSFTLCNPHQVNAVGLNESFSILLKFSREDCVLELL